MELKADLSIALAMMECPEDSPVAAELTDMFYKLQPQLLQLCEPGARYFPGKLPFDGIKPSLKKGRSVIFSIITLGDGVSDFIKNEFHKGNHLQALLADAMVSSMLFSYQDKVAEKVAVFAKNESYGIEGVYEAPGDIDAGIHDYIVEVTKAEELGISLTSGHMLCPEKSLCQIFLLTNDVKACNYKHDCSKCQSLNCSFRKR